MSAWRALDLRSEWLSHGREIACLKHMLRAQACLPCSVNDYAPLTENFCHFRDSTSTIINTSLPRITQNYHDEGQKAYEASEREREAAQGGKSHSAATVDGRSLTLDEKKRKIQTISSISTRAMTKASLSNAVFLTTELLENVLHRLPMRDLLLAQRVCRKWRSVITENTEMQPDLFFLQKEPEAYLKLAILPPRYNGEVMEISRVQYETHKDPTAVFRSGRYNPLIVEHVMGGDLLMRAAFGVERLVLKKHILSSTNPEASWRRMFLMHPRPTSLRACYHTDVITVIDKSLQNTPETRAGGVVGEVIKKANEISERRPNDTTSLTIFTDRRRSVSRKRDRRILRGSEKGHSIECIGLLFPTAADESRMGSVLEA